MRSRIMVVSGHPEDARHISRMLDCLPIAVDCVESLQQARTQLQQEEYCVILTEAALPDGRWLDVLHLARRYAHQLEVIVTDRLADTRFWAEALNLGAYDVLAQPFHAPEVVRILSNAHAHAQWRAAAAV